MPKFESTVPRRQLGRYLRELRFASGMTIAEAATLVERGSSTLQRLEKGSAERIRVLDVEALCRIYDADDTTSAALLGLAQQAKVKSWYHEYGDLIPENFDVYMGLEVAARSLKTYQIELVPGLLQTADYARAVIKSGLPDESDADIERRVRLRMQRQVLIRRKSRPAQLNVILHETVLHRMVGGSRVMDAQRRHLADLSTQPNVTLRVLPFAGALPRCSITGVFTILDFGKDNKGNAIEPPVVFIPGLAGDIYLEKEADIRRYDRAYEAIQAAALDAQASRDLLRSRR
ncbi:helix-turn-helix domain-containing protein [Nocardia vermiculata]|uniref:Helix-turn-helix domain-containing protein n=1 Tax=Nocardia vermiculata TaxID=257274 RepID=A0A846Y5Q6_9NOCA|nr:helix-turn-helix transcriptional regulator [Nocardia vermiculata]NKY53625.1 helix-turn-helix domain-containing protein [Nocardia vermiculata]